MLYPFDNHIKFDTKPAKDLWTIHGFDQYSSSRKIPYNLRSGTPWNEGVHILDIAIPGWPAAPATNTPTPWPRGRLKKSPAGLRSSLPK